MKALPFNIYSQVSRLSSGWAKLDPDGQLHEGVSMQDGKIQVDFSQDSDRDVIKLKNPTELGAVRKEGIPVFLGYELEKVSELNTAMGDGTKSFMSAVKKWGALDEKNLSSLISYTYPNKLSESNVVTIFVAGSSDPLVYQIADSLKANYYPQCKIVDVMKKYYGVDPNDIVDWEKYQKADPTTQREIDTYLRQFTSTYTLGGTRIPPRSEFAGYIKKSAGLRSGSRRLLKTGHDIDDLIINTIKDEEQKWTTNYLKNPKISQTIAIKMRPTYLFVDDTIIKGSTLKGIFKQLIDVLDSTKFSGSTGSMVRRSMFGYCLFSVKS